ncbi:MAG: GGDEF domain-containing protein [Candidatus Gastranaerophilales bacterium]|nr:GGDEF domain-containing protein [Candidatus Gastranaerophilales bacterium]
MEAINLNQNNLNILPFKSTVNSAFTGHKQEQQSDIVQLQKSNKRKTIFNVISGSIAIISTGFLAKNLKMRKFLSQEFNKMGQEVPVKFSDMVKDVVKLAQFDDLTGLKNKRMFNAGLNKAFNAGKNGEKVCVAMLDIDNFKGVNELLGHDTGDIVLEKTGAILIEVAKKHNIDVYRYGGEEISIIMNGKNPKEATEIVEEVLEKFNKDECIQSYKDAFLKKGQERLVKFQTEQQEFDKLNENIINCILPEFNKIKMINKFLDEKINQSSEFIQKQIKEVKKELEIKTAMEIYQDLVPMFNRRKEIVEVEKWLDHVSAKLNGNQRGFTISGGIADFSEQIKDSKAFIKKADTALEKSKLAGKAKVTVAE